jgi:hypothetical protein
MLKAPRSAPSPPRRRQRLPSRQGRQQPRQESGEPVPDEAAMIDGRTLSAPQLATVVKHRQPRRLRHVTVHVSGVVCSDPVIKRRVSTLAVAAPAGGSRHRSRVAARSAVALC